MFEGIKEYYIKFDEPKRLPLSVQKSQQHPFFTIFSLVGGFGVNFTSTRIDPVCHVRVRKHAIRKENIRDVSVNMKFEGIRDLELHQLLGRRQDSMCRLSKVSQQYRKQGHATRLMGIIVKSMKAQLILGWGPLVKMIFLHASIESKEFIKDLGFSCANTDFYKQKRDSYSLMQLDISSKREPQLEWFQKFKLIYDKEFPKAQTPTLIQNEVVKNVVYQIELPKKFNHVNKNAQRNDSSQEHILRKSLTIVTGWPRHVKSHTTKGMPKDSVFFVSILLKPVTQSKDAHDQLVTQPNGTNDQLVTQSNYTYLNLQSPKQIISMVNIKYKLFPCVQKRRELISLSRV
ncbi:UNKNOWN [Stylonychia lemnae]|uniref:Uncharacterized protein n=1 Tax=Stylonychia lemnae TaxID=5949 RepID=A0A078AVS2_STYLE|nr:UNKNOWN [Stylonychia lemnae]|eukprot:CDW85352.1 UNKNOWN [Stylonychia lemnae]